MLLSPITSSLLGSLILLFPISVSGRKNVVVEQFVSPVHAWYSLNDPVMGGLSNGVFTLVDGAGVFDGEVKDVPSLSAPGFIAMRTGRGGFFPDLRSCEGLILNAKSNSAYEGFRMSFGTNSAGTMPYAQGYKTRFDAPVGDFGNVTVSFTDFSDNWDPKTGDIVVSCADNNQYCPDDATLQNFERFEIMAEGVKGAIHLEIKSIHATGCDDDVSENPDPSSNSGGQNRPTGNAGFANGNGGFGDRNGDRDDAIGGNGGYMKPTILENGDVRIESFDDPQHRWFPNNDPVMGGESQSTVSVQNDAGIFKGEVVDVPFLKSPGFVKMETRGGKFPDVSMCSALKIRLKSMNSYEGIRVTFGVHHASNTQPYVRGYKAHLENPPVGTFGEVIMPFTSFSDAWDAGTGDIMTSCAQNSNNCVDDKTLQDFTTFSFMGEGVDGEIHLEIKSIDATGCTHSATMLDSANGEINDDEINGVINSVAWAVIVIGFVLVGATAFYTGWYKGKRSKGADTPIVGTVTPNNDVV